jgi:hypothetical protein
LPLGDTSALPHRRGGMACGDDAMRRRAVIPVLIAVGAVLAGCGLGHKLGEERAGLGDRCADVMKMAIPFAEIDIHRATSENTGVTTFVAHVEGTRTDLPKDTQLPRDVAADCRFDGDILSGFHWTKGGPPPP